MEQKEIICPICNKDMNTRMVRTWVIGDKVFELNGTTSMLTGFPDYFPKRIMRGSSVIILFSTEQCSHMWLEETYFHKGNTFRDIATLTDEQVMLFGRGNITNMWRG